MTERPAKNSVPPDWTDEEQSGAELIRVLVSRRGTKHVGRRRVQIGGSQPPPYAKVNEDGSYYEPRCGHIYRMEFEQNWMELADFFSSPAACKRCKELTAEENQVFEGFTYSQLIPIFRVAFFKLIGRRLPGVALDEVCAVYHPMESRLWFKFREWQDYITDEVIGIAVGAVQEVTRHRLKLLEHKNMDWLKSHEVCIHNVPVAGSLHSFKERYRGETVPEFEGRFVAKIIALTFFRDWWNES